jgi:disulfide bond formation protein DsbB
MMPDFLHRAEAKLILATGLGFAGIGGAWFSELVLGYVPCMLCLWQRWPYYIALPLAIAGLLALRGEGSRRYLPMLAAVLGVIFVVSFGLGVFHAGVEWKLWAGPAGCGGRLTTTAPSLEDFRKSLNTARVVLCDEAAMRILGLSFAGWNAVVSALIAGLFFSAARKPA